ncbi:MAG: cysteine desulfurase family protein [Chthoniobacterales bacterium]
MIYLDCNATTPLCHAAREAMRPYLEKHFGNPSSVHAAGREARAGVDNARDQLAALLGARSGELIFTSSGTEANNLAVLGLARAHRGKGRHLICASTEHHAVLHAFERLQKHDGFEVTFLQVDRSGRIDPNELRDAIQSDTVLVSVMAANNETGVLQPMAEISECCAERGVSLHSDMVQSFGKVPTDLSCDGIAAASFAAHKFGGPKGAGLLFLRAGIPIESIQFGGAHENQRRPGTENVAAIAGMAAAAAWTSENMGTEQERQRSLRDLLWTRVATVCPAVTQNGNTAHRLANTLNVSFPGIGSETMLMVLDVEGVCASSGSACMVGSVVASHVLLAMGLPTERANSAIRFSLGKQTTAEEIESAGVVVERVLDRLAATQRSGRHAHALG